MFATGTLVMTSGIAHEASNNPNFALEINSIFNRYIKLDWGDLGQEDKKANDDAIKNGERILGAYNVKTSDSVQKVYIITEWDRSVTTILFASEY